MAKSQIYYYDDVVFQLELNLQNVRRDLIKLLEEYRFNECFGCNRLKCCCSRDSSFRSTTLSIASSDSAYPHEYEHCSMDPYYNAAPPAKTLPTPRWPVSKTCDEHAQENNENDSLISVASLNVWIRASIPNATQSNSMVSFPAPCKVLDDINYSWPPFPKSIWSKESLKETTERENMLRNECEQDGCSSVDAFFKYFSKNTGLKPRSHIDG